MESFVRALIHVHNLVDPERQWKRAIESLQNMSNMDISLAWIHLSKHASQTGGENARGDLKVLFKRALREGEPPELLETDTSCHAKNNLSPALRKVELALRNLQFSVASLHSWGGRHTPSASTDESDAVIGNDEEKSTRDHEAAGAANEHNVRGPAQQVTDPMLPELQKKIEMLTQRVIEIQTVLTSGNTRSQEMLDEYKRFTSQTSAEAKKTALRQIEESRRIMDNLEIVSKNAIDLGTAATNTTEQTRLLSEMLPKIETGMKSIPAVKEEISKEILKILSGMQDSETQIETLQNTDEILSQIQHVNDHLETQRMTLILHLKNLLDEINLINLDAENINSDYIQELNVLQKHIDGVMQTAEVGVQAAIEHTFENLTGESTQDEIIEILKENTGKVIKKTGDNVHGTIENMQTPIRDRKPRNILRHPLPPQLQDSPLLQPADPRRLNHRRPTRTTEEINKERERNWGRHQTEHPPSIAPRNITKPTSRVSSLSPPGSP